MHEGLDGGVLMRLITLVFVRISIFLVVSFELEKWVSSKKSEFRVKLVSFE